MQGLVFDIKRFAIHDGPGIRTTIFLKGCPLRCWWCHNPESQGTEPETESTKVILDGVAHEKKTVVGNWMTVDELMEIIDKEAVFYDESGGGVTLSGGEPLMQATFAKELLKACKAKGYHTTVDTCGYVKPKLIEDAAEFVDLFLYDLKHPDKEAHMKFTHAELEPILQNLKLLLTLNKDVIVRIPVIPGINDQMENMIKFLQIIELSGEIQEIHLLPYHAMADNKYNRFRKENKLSNLENMDKKDLAPLKQLFEDKGFKVKIGG